MIRYVIRRLLSTVVVMGVVAFAVFSLLYLTPGDPAAVIAGDIATLALLFTRIGCQRENGTRMTFAFFEGALTMAS